MSGYLIEINSGSKRTKIILPIIDFFCYHDSNGSGQFYKSRLIDSNLLLIFAEIDLHYPQFMTLWVW